jgi:hypothetical protein
MLVQTSLSEMECMIYLTSCLLAFMNLFLLTCEYDDSLYIALAIY